MQQEKLLAEKGLFPSKISSLLRTEIDSVRNIIRYRFENQMKVVIFRGGLGTQISEETQLTLKPMVEIGSLPIIRHVLKIYSAHGLNDIIICCGHKCYVIKEYFANYFCTCQRLPSS